MARTPGSGWGGGIILYQVCPHCKKKKMYYKQSPIVGSGQHFYCTSCKEWDKGEGLIKQTYRA